jgi:hypothetical protein
MTDLASASSARRRAAEWHLAVPFLLVAALIVARNPSPILRAEFWAEDGPEFFALAVTQGWKSLYTPVYGYQFLLSRMIAYCATFFPIVAAPYIYAAGCLLFNAVAIGYFSLERFSWVISSRSVRILVCLFLVIAPGGGEVMMNLCNLVTPLSLLALLVLIENPTQLSWGRFWAVLFLTASAGPVFLLAPVVIYLAWQNGDRRYLWLFLGMLPVFAANVVGNHVIGSKNGLLNYYNGFVIPQSLADNFAIRLFVLPILGAGRTAKLMASNALVFWPSCLAGAAWLWVLWRRGLERSLPSLAADTPIMLLFVGYACAISTFAAIAVSRSYAAHQIIRQFGDPLWHLRYSYLPGAVAILLWATVLYRLFLLGHSSRVLACAMFVAITANHVEQWTNYPDRGDAHWPDVAHAIQRAVDAREAKTLEAPVTLTVPVQPAGWHGGTFNLVIVPN